MEKLIKDALDKAYALLNKQVPATKNIPTNINISDVKPTDLPSFIKDNNIPDSAYFDSDDNNDIVLTWEINVPTTDVEKLAFKKKRFNSVAFKFIYDSLTSNGYKRVGFSSGLLKEFADTTVYDMYLNKELDRLVKYYSLYFVKA